MADTSSNVLNTIEDYVNMVGYLPIDASSARIKQYYKDNKTLVDTEYLTSLRIDRKIKEFARSKKEGLELMDIQRSISKSIQTYFMKKCPQFYMEKESQGGATESLK